MHCCPAPSPAVIVSAVYITSKLSLRANKRSKDALQKASAYAKEVLSNVRTVYSFDAGERCAETYIGKVEEPLKVRCHTIQGFLANVAHTISS